MASTDPTDRMIRYALYGGFGVLVIFTIWLQWFWSTNSMDIDVYWEAGTRMLSGGTHLYAESDDPVNKVGDFIYPPLFATLFAPLTLLPRGIGYALWGMIQLLLLAGGFLFARKTVNVESASDARAFYLLLGTGLFGAIWITLQEGQVNLLVAVVLAAGVWLTERRRALAGGLLFAVATHLKVIPIVLLPLLIAQKRFKAAGAMLVGVVVLWAAPLVYTIPAHGFADGFRANTQLHADYLDTVVSPRLKRQYAFDLGGARAPNNSIAAVTRRYLADDHELSLNTDARSPLIAVAPRPVIKYTGLAVGALLGALAMALAWRRRDSLHGRVAALGLGLVAGSFANLLFWPHHLCVLLLVLAPMAASGMRREDLRTALACVILLMLLVYIPLLDRLPPLDWMGILGAPTLGILVVWLLTFIHFWRRPIATKPANSILPAHEEEKARDPAA